MVGYAAGNLLQEMGMGVTVAGSAVMPLAVSGNGRFFLRKDGQPFFWLGDTLWHLFRDYTVEEVREILRRRKAAGFNVALAMLLGYEGEPRANLEGELPFVDGDPGRMNERYFAHVDAAVRAACELDFVLVLGVYHKAQARFYSVENARASARWIAERYRDVPQIIWSMYPEARRSYLPVMRALAMGLAEGDGGRHWITVHPDPSPQSSSFVHGEPWLAFHMLQACNDIHLVHPMVLADTWRTPIRPVVMAEGGYETAPFTTIERRMERRQRREAGEDVSGFQQEGAITAVDIRRQAYWTYLAGGHHVYGHDGNHRQPKRWREWVDSPGAASLGVFRKVVEALPRWWEVVPDQSLIMRGAGEGSRLNAAGHSETGDWVMVYFSAAGSAGGAMIRMDAIKSAERARGWWVNPADGSRGLIGEFTYGEFREFVTPAGWEDAVLLLEATT